jgi:hypothetical protein
MVSLLPSLDWRFLIERITPFVRWKPLDLKVGGGRRETNIAVRYHREIWRD